MKILGMDPGAGGGLAVLDGQDLVSWQRMPMMKPEVGKPIVDVQALMHFFPFDLGRPIDRAVIERVHAMPRQGVASAFQFGRTTGTAEGIVRAMVDVTVWVEPAKWKRDMGLTADKTSSLDRAAALWPDIVDWDVKANDGIAEAALLAWWHRSQIDATQETSA